MDLKDNKVWGVRDDTSVTLFRNEEDAKARYGFLLNYYKKHTQRTDNDYWVYNVWHEVDDGEMHYACISACIDDDGFRTKNFSISYSEYLIG